MIQNKDEEILTDEQLNKFFKIAGINPQGDEIDIDLFLAGLEKKSI